MKKTLALALAIFAAATLTACGGGGGEPAPTQVAAADTTLTATAATLPAATNVPFAYPAGVPSFGTTGTTTVTFSGTSTTPAFSIATSTGTATGVTTFGSCIFSVTAVSGSVGTLKIGDVIEVKPCNLNVNTAGAPANGVAVTRSISLDLGNAVSSSESIQIGVNPGGELTLNGKTVGTVTLKPVTG
jgi:ABC-type glycerol-3-phosphate transport system substrate-binding protein